MGKRVVHLSQDSAAASQLWQQQSCSMLGMLIQQPAVHRTDSQSSWVLLPGAARCAVKRPCQVAGQLPRLHAVATLAGIHMTLLHIPGAAAAARTLVQACDGVADVGQVSIIAHSIAQAAGACTGVPAVQRQCRGSTVAVQQQHSAGLPMHMWPRVNPKLIQPHQTPDKQAKHSTTTIQPQNTPAEPCTHCTAAMLCGQHLPGCLAHCNQHT